MEENFKKAKRSVETVGVYVGDEHTHIIEQLSY